MANPQRIGLYLSDDNIVLAESNPKKLLKVSSSQITTSLTASAEVPFHSDIAEEIHIVSTFQRLLRENKIEPGQVFVSIPIKDIFLRSFVVPWMPTNELPGVVYYEAKKYVPFDLKLLDYVYQGTPFFENKQKKLRIIFYAVRKQTIEKYDRILKQAGCRPVLYESSLFSLAKYLVSKNLLRLDQKTVVIYTHQEYGQIIFYEKGISNFVREFTLTVEDVHDPKAVADVLRAQLMREVRKSLGYYSRQFSQEKIKEVLVLSASPDPELMKTLAEELSVKVRAAEPSVTTGLQTVTGMDVMCASGAGSGKVPPGFNAFNFLLAKSLTQTSATAGKSLSGQFSQLLNWKMSDVAYAIQAAVICGLILIGGFVYGQINLSGLKKLNDELAQSQGELATKSVDELNNTIKRNEKKLESLKTVFTDRSGMAGMLIELTKVLPEGLWMDEFLVRYNNSRLSVELKGYVYSANQDAQFKTANDFLARLRSIPYFVNTKFKLNSIQKRSLDGHDVAYFSISGT